MKIVYHSWHGGHAASVVAAVHLGMLPESGRPSRQEVLSAPYFGRLGRHDRGFLFSCGHVDGGHEVFVADWGRDSTLMVNAVRSAAQLTGENPGEFVLIECARANSYWWHILAYIVRVFGGSGRYRDFVAQTLLRHYPRLVQAARTGRDKTPS